MRGHQNADGGPDDPVGLQPTADLRRSLVGGVNGVLAQLMQLGIGPQSRQLLL
jgi:hypothetical protein